MDDSGGSEETRSKHRQKITLLNYRHKDPRNTEDSPSPQTGFK